MSHYIILGIAAGMPSAHQLAAALAAASPLFATSAAAQTAEPAATGPAQSPAGAAEKAHPDPDQSIVITGVRRSAADVLGSVTVMSKEELTRDLKPSIGDTLAQLPGVSASSFGPTASRPILRGLAGERVRILTDGIGSLDLSSSDPDHAVSINPLTAERIEVLRGPSSLLYGSSAIGGVVNVIDTRIPRSVPADGVSGDALAHYGTAAHERAVSASVNAALGGHFVAHVDGNISKYDDLRIGGFVLSRALRQQAQASPDLDIQALADLKRKLPNSAGRLDDIAGGLAYVDGGLNLGVSISHHDAKYGVPVRYSLDPAIEPEVPTIDAKQDRADARAEVPLGGFISSVNFRGGIAKYHHNEIEEDGSIGSRFFSNGGEARLELVQTGRGGWSGTSGIQYLNQDVRIRGEEKYLPDSRNKSFGLFTLQSLIRGPLRFEGGLRIEFSRLTAATDADIAAEPDGPPEIGLIPLSRRFTPVSGAIGGNYDFGAGWRVGLSLSHSERAPSIDELFSKGPHGGSQSFVVGNPHIGIEKSNGAELSLNQASGPVHVQGSLYYSRFSNFIYQVPTGEIADGLPLYEYFEGKADYYGFEVGADAKFGQALGVNWDGELVADAVRAKIARFGPAPQIPPFRVLGALTGARSKVDGRLEVERVSAQRRTAPNETTTPGYTMVNASIDWHPLSARPALTLSLQGNNLFDVDARRAASQLKDYAPLAGRDIRLSARLRF
ncbi:MAG: TonB-dependent receptor [Sphingomicrobium sp.]